MGSCPGSKGLEAVAWGLYLRKRLERFRGKVITALCLIYTAAVGHVYSSLIERK